MRHLIIGTAGHIDHGKTRLVQALTGINADRLKEERRRGITIDLGFAHAQLGSFQVGFIDVPGHERFVKNMLAGVGGVQFVLLVVAADESIMPQTREHFEICRLLGIRHGIVVITKSDLVDPELIELVREEVGELLRGTILHNAPMQCVDSHSGRGIDQLRALLEEQLIELDVDDELQERRHFRLPIDRVFSLKGFGTVVTGTTWQGRIRKEDKVQAYPSDSEGRVRNLQIYGRSTDAATVGQRTALNLTGLDKGKLERGTMLGPPGVFRASSILDVGLELLAGAPAPVRRRTPVRFHHGSREVIGRVYPIAKKKLGPGQSGLVQLRLEAPVIACSGDRFIIRRYSPLTTIGGGIVLDGQAPKRKRRDLEGASPDLRTLQEAWAGGSTDCFIRSIDYYVSSAGAQGASVAQLQAHTGMTERAVRELLAAAQKLTLLEAADLAVADDSLAALKDRMVDYTRRFHDQHPLLDGVPREELKERCMSWASNSYFNAALLSLEAESRVRASAHTVSHSQHRATLTPDQEQLQERILQTLEASPHSALGIHDLAAQLGRQIAEINDVFFFLIQQGLIVRISDSLFMTSQQVSRLKTGLLEAHPSGTSFSVADFKNLFGLTRKLAIPFLEYLDKSRVTKRAGNRRIVL